MQRRDFFTLPTIAAGMFLPGTQSLLAGDKTRQGSRLFPIDEFGAVAGGVALSTVAIQAAIEAAARSGGGTVYVPPGTFLSGGIVLKSHVTLYLEAGAVLLGSTRFEDYAAQAGPSNEGDANSHHLVFARDADDVTIAGPGVIDGQGQSYWTYANRPQPRPEDQWADVVQFDYKATPRRPAPMLEFAYCRNLRLEGFTLRNAPSWTLRPVGCETVTIRGLRIRNPIFGPNTDGIDITASSNVFISDCDIVCGDDAICIKSENPYGALLPTRNITITNCVLRTCCNGFKIGTATHGVIENIVFSNSVIDSGEVPLNQRVIAGLALEMVDGGSLDGVLVSNIRMKNVRTPIFVRLAERRGGRESSLRNVLIQGINATGAIYTSSITGLPGHTVQGVTLRDVTIHTEEHGQAAWVSNVVPEHAEEYPEARMFGRLPAAGLYVRHAERVRLRDVEFVADAEEERPALVCDDVEDVVIDGLLARAPAGSKAIVSLRDVRHAFLEGCRLIQPRAMPLRVEGATSAMIVLRGSVLRGDTKNDVAAISYGDGATAAAVDVR